MAPNKTLLFSGVYIEERDRSVKTLLNESQKCLQSANLIQSVFAAFRTERKHGIVFNSASVVVNYLHSYKVREDMEIVNINHEHNMFICNISHEVDYSLTLI